VDFVDRWLRNSDDLAPHLLLVGRTGSGKTTAARIILSRALRATLYEIIVLDWDGEYVELPLPIYAPPFHIAAPPMLLADALSEVERSEEGGHMVSHYLRKVLAATTLERAAERLRADISLSVTPLRGVLEAAAARLEIVAKHVEFVPFRPDDAELGGLREGVYLLAGIASIWERASVQQFLAMFHTLARRSPVPSLLVVEEGGMGARTTFLRHLMALARRRNVRLIFITQGPLPPPELRQSFEVLLFDSDPELRRALRAAIPDSALQPGECWWVRRDGTARKQKFRPR
jgi:DNA polymerase III delta prime subunit